MGEKVSKKKKMWMLLLCVLVLLFSLIFIFNYINDNTQQNKDVLVTIQKEELQDMIDNGKTCWVYVGRDSCPDCQVFYPKLVEFLQTQQLHIYYYNTECKASEKQKVRAYYNSLGVKSVPTILEIFNGTIKEVYDVQSYINGNGIHHALHNYN